MRGYSCGTLKLWGALAGFDARPAEVPAFRLRRDDGRLRRDAVVTGLPRCQEQEAIPTCIDSARRDRDAGPWLRALRPGNWAALRIDGGAGFPITPR